jgi:hypothetical protein
MTPPRHDREAVRGSCCLVAVLLIFLEQGEWKTSGARFFAPGEDEPVAPITEAGRRLAAALDALEVEKRWLPNERIDWKTGLPATKPATGRSPRTHCSAFAAAVCVTLKVPMLTPPPETLLANRQHDWLRKEGKALGWKRVDAVEAQRLANEGKVVLASCKSTDPKRPGHIAVVRPGTRGAEQVRAVGPDIIQAGGKNYNRTTVVQGFRNHPGAWKKGEVLFFAFVPPPEKPPVGSGKTSPR